MKNLLLLAFVLTGFSVWSQDSIAKPFNKEYFRIYYVAPGAVGNNVLAKANEGKYGAGLAVALYSYQRFHFFLGYEISKYDITDASLAGNIETTWISNAHIGALYKLPIAKNIDFNPRFAIGYFGVNQRQDGDNYGKQFGPAFSPGADIDFKIAGGFRLFAGVNYTVAFPETHTNKEFQSFFGTLQQFNIVAGIKF